jgi:hypothetical protein
MRIRIGYDISYSHTQETPIIAMLEVHHSRRNDLEKIDLPSMEPTSGNRGDRRRAHMCRPAMLSPLRRSRSVQRPFSRPPIAISVLTRRMFATPFAINLGSVAAISRR